MTPIVFALFVNTLESQFMYYTKLIWFNYVMAKNYVFMDVPDPHTNINKTGFL